MTVFLKSNVMVQPDGAQVPAVLKLLVAGTGRDTLPASELEQLCPEHFVCWRSPGQTDEEFAQESEDFGTELYNFGVLEMVRLLALDAEAKEAGIIDEHGVAIPVDIIEE